MTITSLTEFLKNGNCGARGFWPKDRWVCLDPERGVCLLKQVKDRIIAVSDYIWPIEDLAADDWNVVFIKEQED